MANGKFSDLLQNGGFQAFLWTQFLGALNDNLYKIIVSMRAVHIAAGESSRYLSLAGVVFVAPFLLFSGYSGHLADVVSKRSVLVGVKVFEIFVMCAGIAAFFTTRIEWMLAVLFLMALHSTLFSPAKYGIVPEMLPDKDLSRANALLEMTTFVAIVVGTAAGSLLFSAWKHEPWKMGLAMVAVAGCGFLSSLGIPKVPAAGAPEAFRWNPFGEVAEGTRRLLEERPLWLTVLGISYFWFLGALFQMDLLLFGGETLKAGDLQVGLMVTCLAVGIGLGSMLAGRLSGDKVELGLVPLGAVGMGVLSLALYGARGSYVAAVIVLALLGVASGLFIVPLHAFLQQRAGEHEKGRIIATNNIYNTGGLLLASAVLWVCHDHFKIGPDRIILCFGVATLLVTVYITTVVNDFFIRFLLWLATHTIFRIRIDGQERVPFRGPALLVSNHMSHVDGFLIAACVQRFIRFLVWRPYYESKPLHWFFQLTKAIPVGGGGRREAVESIRAARAELSQGHIVCIFAEGAISRTGKMLPFKRGMEKIVEGMDVPLIPVHLDRLWGSIFSFEGGKFFWKWPKRFPYPVTVSFGTPMPASAAAHEVRQAIQELAADAWSRRADARDRLDLRVIRTARRNWGRLAMADSTGRELTYGQMLAGSVLVANRVRQACAGAEMTGVLLPSSIGGALANIGLTLAGHVPVNLNFTAGREAMASAIRQCGIRTVITSQVFLAKAKLAEPEGAVFLEDILARATKWERLKALVWARLLPARRLCRGGRGADSTATVIFSSGTTGVPKGVMLSHFNVLSNVDAIAQVFWTGSHDRVVGILPFFHSFGFTVTIWFPLVTGCGVVYHSNPTDAKAIGELVSKYKATLLLSTPTFCATYARKCAREEFASVRFAMVGAEKLREPVAAAFLEKFGIELLEGYGCTEMAPVVAVNSPDFEAGHDTQTGNKRGTVGHPLPGIAAKIVDPATMRPLGPNEQGLLLVKGPNRMLGYLGQPERTADVCPDGWYITGDIALLDDEGFIRITDRISRFSKIAGEMVPHLRIEEAISAVSGGSPAAVAALADEQKGERLAALYVAPGVTPEELWQRLAGTDLPRLWLPKRENLYPVSELPVLGSGKLDLQAVKARLGSLAASANGGAS